MATLARELGRTAAPSSRRFLAAIFAGSFLLFVIQPMIARMALPRLGGAPSVWNSAMLVYQVLLLVGYAYAHWLGRLRPRAQAAVHIALLVTAALMLPIGLVGWVPPPNANAFLWVPWLLLVSIGPLFFAVSAQAPLLQRWFALTDGGDPYRLYVASNLGSFGGLIAYPLLFEPLLSISQQRWFWSAAYGVMILLVTWCSARLPASQSAERASHPTEGAPSWRTIGHWMVLATIPSGLILSTTLHITTDIIAMPLLWVVPLGAYLLSFSVAFSASVRAKQAIVRLSPLVLLFACLALFLGQGWMAMLFCLVAIVNLFTVSVTLHSRLFDTRPPPQQLTYFYLAMSVGGVLGGAFCALIAPLIFDWTYEYLLLLVAAAWLIRGTNPFAAAERLWAGDAPARHHTMIALALLALFAIVGAFTMQGAGLLYHISVVAILGIAIAAIGTRALFTVAVAALIMTTGGLQRVEYSAAGTMTRSFFGIYSIREGARNSRILVHGTTIHGVQNLGSPERERMETSYYAPPSGVGLAMQATPGLFGPDAHIAVVGLGAGTLACYARPGQSWTFYEIDPRVVAIARDPRRFTFLSRCKPDARIEVGDARLLIEREPPRTADVLVVDAFSSDAVPMHLLTSEAFADYARLLAPSGLLLVHVSNRYIDLNPVVASAARARGWVGALRRYRPDQQAIIRNEGASDWIAMSPSRATLGALVRGSGARWTVLAPPRGFEPWTDDHSSVLPLIDWGGKQS
jgi:SAM-dependent methyltransferase